MSLSRSAFRVAMLYSTVAMLWILFSDYLLVALGLEPVTQRWMQTYKGILFVVVTTALVFFASLRHLNRRAEQQRLLQLNQERFDLALAGSNDGVWDWDIEAGSVYFSDRCLEIIGYPRASDVDLGVVWLQRVHPDDLAATRQAIRSHFRGATERFDNHHRIKTLNGDYAWIHARGRAIRNAQNRAVRLIGIVRDVTEQKLNEESLQQATVVMESTTEGVVITDAQNRIVSVNPAFCRITGYDAETAIGQTPSLLKSGWHPDQFYTELWRQLRSTGTWQGEIWNRRQDGEIYPQWETINAVHDESGGLSHYVAVFADISQIKRSQEEIDFLAHHDPLTRLPNRLLMIERLGNALSRAKRNDNRLGLIFIDIDRFKAINDSMGHTAGDELLRAAAERIAGLCREQDTLARLSGDEFIMLVEDLAEAADLTPFALRVQRAFDKPFDIDDRSLHLSCSLGMSVYPEDGEDSGELLKNADTAVTLAKKNGRNTYAFYTQALTHHARRQMTLESDLHKAIRDEQLRVYFQPQKDLTSGQIVGMEALVRWEHPKLGIISPMDFLPAAQHAGLMSVIDEYVLHVACGQMRRWLDRGFALETMAVNMSGYWLQRGEVIAAVQAALKDTGLPAHYLELEVTEDEIMEHGEKSGPVLDALRNLGVKLAIDDFGTGYSSLLRLKRLPVTKLKIDRGFTMDLPGDINDSAIARAIIALGKSLQLTITAEGIETLAQESLLGELQCDYGQGYLYSKPVPAEQLEALLRKSFPDHDKPASTP
ncbi:putative bifunctional diguanylate cyclase/phosphodiesterase [Pseudomonas profundi]|uniref:putative bifunctional diguanylate cyclase/phosphodiesterase n=1 Tax=Pseudomonas profundi TaxID=1981513 RepID=UPI00123C6878|nr:bifunctional diguanylate cyclase/phosphodiesterase [Pseudomonas profundi]